MNPAEGTSHQELLKLKPSLYQFEKEIGIINQKADCRQKQKQPKLMFEPLDRRNHTFICCKRQQKEREQISSYRYGISQISQRENEIRQPSLNSGIKKKVSLSRFKKNRIMDETARNSRIINSIFNSINRCREKAETLHFCLCLLYTSPSPRD